MSSIDLSQLPPPEVVETIDYQVILQGLIDDFIALYPELAASVQVESSPIRKLLQAVAYREVLFRQRVNDAVQGTMLAYALRSDLDQIGANFGVARLVIDEGDPTAIPPVPPTYEDDEDFRGRVALALEGITTAGSEGSYIFHGLGASGDVKDIQAVSPSPGVVTVFVLSREGDGTASPALIGAVNAALNADDIRPLTDLVTVQSAAVAGYSIVADLTMYPGPDSELIRAKAESAVRAYAAAVHRIGYDVTLSGLYAALHQPGVQRVTLISPAADIVNGVGEAAFASSITVRDTGVPDV